jgi:tRNA U38,U39,U40 pseudouridine synthase TruA
MGGEAVACPECDLPERWHSRYSEKKRRYFYVHMPDPLKPRQIHTQWEHPTEGNPLSGKRQRIN